MYYRCKQGEPEVWRGPVQYNYSFFCSLLVCETLDV